MLSPLRFCRTIDCSLTATTLHLTDAKMLDHDNDSNTSQNSDVGENEENHSNMSEEDIEDDEYNGGEHSDEDDYKDPPKHEVEVLEYSLGESLDHHVTLELYLQENNDEFQSWMQTIHIRCCYDGKKIGKGLGRFVKRDHIRSDFWRDMEEPCEELANIAFDVFDRYGGLKQELMDHVVRKGTACWGSELHLGSLFIIEYMHIDKQWRRKGIGRKMVTSLIDKARAGGRSPSFSLVSPGWLNDDIGENIDGKSNTEKQEICFRARSDAISFYRSLGFRRIGASYCFDLASDPNHQAHKLLAVDDFDLPQGDAEENEPDTDDEAERTYEGFPLDPDKINWRLKLLQTRLPLHHATITLPDNECVELFKKFKKTETFKDHWVKVDRFHNNVLHVAASALTVKVVQWLLENANNGQLLSASRNIKGYTPLEELESHLESERTILKHGMM